MKIQPIDIDSQAPVRAEPAKPVLKSRLKRLFDRQLPSVLRISSVDKPPSSIEAQYGANSKDEQFEPSSVCLAKMVQSYMEESNDKPFRGRHRCNCFNGNGNDSSDDEFDVFGNGFGESMGTAPSGDACDFLKVNKITSIELFLLVCPYISINRLFSERNDQRELKLQ
jgi:hypothetical protein